MKLSICLFLILSTANALALEGRVVSVHDGDTVTVLDKSNIQHKVRLAEIDAPELNQAWGKASKKALSDMVFNKQVKVNVETTDRYGREVGTVYINGKNVNYTQIENGAAWAYTAYTKTKAPSDIETAARKRQIGLWSQTNAIPPWEWRKKN